MPWLRQKNESCADRRRRCSYSLMHAGLEWIAAVKLNRSVWPICLSDRGKVTERLKVVFRH